MDTALFDLFVDSFWQILLPGLTVTIPLTAIAFSGALVIAVVVALIQYAHVPVLKDLARFYIWVTRGTPLLVQLFVVFYGLPHAGVLINPFVAAVVVFADDHPNRVAPGFPNSFPDAWQFAHCHGEGHITCGQHHRHGNVYDNAAHRGTHLRTFVALHRSWLDLPHFLHGSYAPSELRREVPENLCLPLRQRNIACC